jgi:hypothetical protein
MSRDIVKSRRQFGIVGYRRLPIWRRLWRWLCAPSPWY